MPEEATHDTDHHADHRPSIRDSRQTSHASTEEVSVSTPDPAALYGPSLLGKPGLNGRGNQGVKIAALQSVQQTYGNRATQRFIQRTPPSGTPTATQAPPANTAATPASNGTTAAPATPAEWQAPLDLGVAHTHSEAIFRLIQLSQMLDSLRDSIDESQAASFQDDYAAIHRLEDGLPHDNDPLTVQDVTPINIAVSMIVAHYNEVMTVLRDRTRQAIEQLVSAATSADPQIDLQFAALNEDLHNAFVSNNVGRVQQIRNALNTFKDYKEKGDTVVTWARRANSIIGSARATEVLEAVRGRSAQLGTGIGYVQDFLVAAQAITTLSGIDGQAINPMQNSIGQMRAALGAIDLTMSLAKGIPLIGTLWSDYYRPMTEACLRGLARIATIQDREVRLLTLLDWSDRSGSGAPTIPRDAMEHFPGGQPVLNYMFGIVNGGEAQVTPAVEQFFVQHHDLFNAAAGTDQMGTESQSHWYNPLSWGNEDRAPHLGEWIERNQDTVWAQLYGDMPHNLRQ